MMTTFTLWLIASVPAGLLAGCCIRAGMEEAQP
jgi:hypothetical protein